MDPYPYHPTGEVGGRYYWVSEMGSLRWEDDAELTARLGAGAVGAYNQEFERQCAEYSTRQTAIEYHTSRPSGSPEYLEQ